MMGIRGFKTKAQLKARVKRPDGQADLTATPNAVAAPQWRPLIAQDVVIETSMFGPELRDNGKFCVVGPSPYERKWFAEITVVDGVITKVS